MFCILQYTKNDKKCKCILHIICMCAIFYGYQYIHISCIGIFQICALNYYLYIYLVISHCYILDFTFWTTAYWIAKIQLCPCHELAYFY